MHKERRRGVCDVQLSSIPKVLYPSILCAMSNLKFETSHIKLLESCLVLKLSASLIFVFKRSIDKIRRARNVIKEAKIRHHNIDISRTNNKELFFHGSITFVSLFLYQNWWGWKADLWNRRLAWKEWKLKTKLKVECKLLWWLKPSFYPEPSQKASKKAHLCNHQQVDLVSTLRKLFEKGWRQIRLFDKSIKRHPNPPKVLGLRTFSLGLLVAWRETYLYVWGVGRVDGDALSDEHPHVGRQVVDLGQVRSPRLKQICWRIGAAVEFFLPVRATVWTSRPPKHQTAQQFSTRTQHYQHQ